MSVTSKHLATFLLGAAAGFAAYKYSQMTDEEKEKMMANLKEKAKSFKDDAENAVDKAREYFEELRTKGSGVMKDHFPEAEAMFNDLFSKKEKPGTTS